MENRRPVLDNFKDCFLFFMGMPAAYFGSQNGDPLDITLARKIITNG